MTNPARDFTRVRRNDGVKAIYPTEGKCVHVLQSTARIAVLAAWNRPDWQGFDQMVPSRQTVRRT